MDRWENTNTWPLWAKIIGVIGCAAFALFLAYTHNPELFP